MSYFKIAAYITAYQDFTALNACIQSLQDQTLLQGIYLLDNSPYSLSLPPSIVPIIYHHYPQNIGIGDGLTLAIDWAWKQHYSFLWLFDQDSQATPGCLQKLVDLYLQLEAQKMNVGIIAPTPVTRNSPQPVLAAIHDRYRFIGQPHQNDRPYYPCVAPITSGSLLNLAAAKAIAPPRGDFFIDGVDIDYGIRLHQAGYGSYIVTTAILQHNFGLPYIISWFGKSKVLQNYSPLRHYYICRNHTYLDVKYAQEFWKIAAILFRFKYLLVILFWIIFFLPNQKKIKVWACLKGTYDGLRGQLGKNWNRV